MKTRRTERDFRVPGHHRFSQKNERGKQAEEVTFFCLPSETDDIMKAIGMAGETHEERRIPAGLLLAQICREWMAEGKVRG